MKAALNMNNYLSSYGQTHNNTLLLTRLEAMLGTFYEFQIWSIVIISTIYIINKYDKVHID